jgi:hypothetical protein
MKPGWIVVGIAAAAFIAFAALRARAVPDENSTASAARSSVARSERVARLVPDSTRVRVEVLNATTTRGLGRRATRYLRDRGFDVVDVGNAPAPRESTLVIDRTGRGDWAAVVAKALGGARVETRPDSSRYLDVTVLLGASWRAPAEPFYP